MRSRQLAICDGDREYLRMLQAYLQKKNAKQMMLHLRAGKLGGTYVMQGDGLAKKLSIDVDSIKSLDVDMDCCRYHWLPLGRYPYIL